MSSLLQRCHSSWRWQQWLSKGRATHVLSCHAFTDRTAGMGLLSVALKSPAATPTPAFERRHMSCMIDCSGQRPYIVTFQDSLQSRGFAGRGAPHRGRDPIMRDCKTIEEAVHLAYDHVDSLSARGLSAFWATVSKLLQRQSRGSARRQNKSSHMDQQMFHQFDILISRTLEDIHAFGYRDMAQTAISLAKIVESIESHRGRLPEGSPKHILQDVLIGNGSEKQFIFNHIACASIPVLPEFDPRSLSNFIYAYAKAGCRPTFEDGSSFFDRVSLEAIPKLKHFNSQDMSNMLWAYATAKEKNSALFEKAGHAIVAFDSLDVFKPQELSNLVWAYATTKQSHPKLFRMFADHIIAHNDLEPFKPQNLSNLLWGYATAKEQHPDLFKKVADQIVGSDNLESFKPQELSNLVWAYATAEQSSPELFRKLASHVTGLDSLDQFNSQNLSNIAWAYATAKDLQLQLFQKLANAAIKRKNELESQAISNLLWAYATNGHIDKHLFSSFIPTTKVLLEQCNGQDLANIAWACAVTDVDAPSLFNDVFIKGCLEKKDDFIPEALRQLYQWHLWQVELKSNIRLPPSLEEKCYKAFVSSAANPSGLQNDVISTLLSLGLNPEEEVLTPSGYSLDVIVEVNGEKIGIEVDGPSHFIDKQPTGSTILKRRLVTNLEEMSLVSVPYWEWDRLKKNSEKKQLYLISLLGLRN